MNRTLAFAIAGAALLAAASLARASNNDGNNNDNGPDTAEVSTFTTLPEGVRFPEGITANPANGSLYVSTFDFGPTTNKLVRLDSDGRVVAQKDFGATPLLGLGFANNKVYILNFGAGKVQRIAANFNAATPVEDVAQIPHVGPPTPRVVGNPDGSSDVITFGDNIAAPNALVFDHGGNMYVSDSFQGAVWRIAAPSACAPACPVALVKQDPLLATAGFPPFGANGLAFNADESILYIANTGDNRVLQMKMADTSLSVLAESVHGADGLLFEDGALWVAANQGDEMVALNAKGRPIARVGSFEGIRGNGSPRGLLFPASMVSIGGWMYVTNLSIALTPAVGDEPEEDVTRWTIARFRNPLRR